MLERGLNPVVLRREQRVRAVATGIWQPTTFESPKPIQACKTVEDLFWAVLSEAFQRAAKRKLLVSVIAEPGWSYETKVESLGRWSGLEVAKADRILWQRTPEE